MKLVGHKVEPQMPARQRRGGARPDRRQFAVANLPKIAAGFNQPSEKRVDAVGTRERQPIEIPQSSNRRVNFVPIGRWSDFDDRLKSHVSAEFLQSGLLPTLRWLRIVGDTVFLSGVAALAWFVLGLKTGWSYDRAVADDPAPRAPAPRPSGRERVPAAS